ncbi:unnamed protein product [Rotaria socialis]|uniref:G-protein coupled receptors family 1 profile domain-containing protein n=1 Tax=Rotaria socialis TaxID=392032 RepID=A0A820KYV2_9BILA|nr:unnamed protein product [Rotaria socialis]
MQQNKIETLKFATNQLWLYGSFLLLIFGLIDNSINALMFSTKLKANPCLFYLLAGDITNSFTLLTNLVSIIFDVSHNRYFSRSKLILCKISTYLQTVFTTVSILMLCLASADHYCSTSRDVRR